EGAGRRQLLLAARDLPGTGPEPRVFELGEGPGGGALLRDEVRAQVPGGVPGLAIDRGGPVVRFESHHARDPPAPAGWCRAARPGARVGPVVRAPCTTPNALSVKVTVAGCSGGSAMTTIRAPMRPLARCRAVSR